MRSCSPLLAATFVRRQLLPLGRVTQDRLEVVDRDGAGVQADQALNADRLSSHGGHVGFVDADGLQIRWKVEIVGQRSNGR